jgi:hypothetical protein
MRKDRLTRRSNQKTSMAPSKKDLVKELLKENSLAQINTNMQGISKRKSKSQG